MLICVAFKLRILQENSAALILISAFFYAQRKEVIQMKTRKLLSLVLALTMMLGMCSINVFAEPAKAVTADVYTVAQLSGGFLAPPQTLEVSSDLSEKYGFADEVNGVSVLDALIKEHEIIYGNDFTKDTVSDYLEVSNGSATKVFGISSSTYYGGFLVNEGYPNDGTASPYGSGYNGTTYTTHKLVSGDKVDFFFYEDSYWADTYTWIDGDLSAFPGEDLEVTVTGSMVMGGYLYKTPEEFKESGEEIEDAVFAWVSEDGGLTEIEDVYTDEDGEAAIPIPDDMEPGIYYLTVMANGEDYISVCIMNPTPVNIGNVMTAYVTISQNADFVTAKDGKSFNRLPVTVSGKREYTIDDVLSAAHDTYADDAHGYETADNGYGLSLSKLWGDTSYAYGYYQNHTSAWSLTDKVTAGDFIYAFVYKDTASWADTYTKFEYDEYSTPAATETEFTLSKAIWTSDNGVAFVPCEGAAVSVLELDGIEAVTDAEGKATLTFPEEGTYTVVAKNANAPIVPASCTVSVGTPIAVTGITLDSELSVYVNESKAIGYEIAPADAADKSVTWESSDDETASVSSGGVVTGVKAGTATITAKTNDGGFSDSCEVTVTEAPSALEIMHNIAAKYAESGIADDMNAPWLAADLAAYKKAFPDTENVLSDEQVQEYLDKLIPAADEATKAGDIAKYIIALRALGFDPENIKTSDFRTVNLVKKLQALIDEENAAVTNIYTLPYVILAMNEDEDYLDKSGTDYLINSAVEQKKAWQDNTWGVDTAAAMLLALSPFYNENEDVKAAVDETIEQLRGAQAADGSFGNASSTGLALTALAAYGIDGAELKTDNPSVLDGLVNYASDTLDGFTPTNNSFGTEQGFRGLVANELLGSNIYDFSDNPKNTAQASWAERCPVTFNLIPDSAKLTIEGQEAVSKGKYDLPAGTYNYTAEKSGYKTAEGTVTVTDEEETNHTAKTVNVSLPSSKSSSDSSSDISVKIKVLTHDKSKCGGAYTYKKNASEYTSLASGTVTLSKGQTVFDALHLILTENNIDYIEKTYGYISSIGNDAEFDHGPNSGWLFQVDGKAGTKSCRDTSLSKNCTVTWFYTDDYSEEAGSEAWKRSSSSGGTTLSNTCKVTFETNGGEKYPVLEVDKGGKMSFVADPERKGYTFEGWFTDKEFTKEFDINEPIVNNITLYAKWEKGPDATAAVYKIYDDVSKGDWFHDAVVYCYEHGLMIGTGDNFEPDTEMTRAMLVTVLYRLDGKYEKATDCKFSDVSADDWYFDSVAWGEANGIILGISDTEFAPGEKVTREQTALILSRYAKFKDCFEENYADLSDFEDKNDISSWAEDGIKWAVGEGIITGMTDTLISPKTTLTRAQAATLLMRFFNLLNK